MGNTWKDSPDSKDFRGSKMARDKRKAQKKQIKVGRKLQRERERENERVED